MLRKFQLWYFKLRVRHMQERMDLCIGILGAHAEESVVFQLSLIKFRYYTDRVHFLTYPWDYKNG